VGGAVVKAGFGKWIGASTVTRANPSGAPGLGPVDEPASGMGSAAAKSVLWGRMEEPAKNGARVGEIAAAETGFRE